MRIHAIETGKVSIKETQRRGRGNGVMRVVNILRDDQWTPPLPIYTWVIEHPEGVIVVDTGETARTSQSGYFPWWHPYPRFAVRMMVKPEDEIGNKLQAIGISPDDVRWVVLTHMHTDHAGGIYHFPHSDIMVSRREYAATAGFTGQVNGYLPQHYPTWLKPNLIDFVPTPVGSFSQSYALTQAGDVQFVATPGHTPGHLSVILTLDGLSYLFAGDVSYTEQQLLDLAVDGVSPDVNIARQTMQRTLDYVRRNPTVYLPSHDPQSAERLAARQVTYGEPLTNA